MRPEPVYTHTPVIYGIHYITRATDTHKKKNKIKRNRPIRQYRQPCVEKSSVRFNDYYYNIRKTKSGCLINEREHPLAKREIKYSGSLFLRMTFEIQRRSFKLFFYIFYYAIIC